MQWEIKMSEDLPDMCCDLAAENQTKGDADIV